MPRNAPLPADNHVSRGCLAGYDTIEGKVIITSAAFVPREVDEKALSTEWVECPHAPEDLRDAPGAFKRQKTYLRKSQPAAILNVRKIREIEQHGRELDVIHWPPKNKENCHCRIIGMVGDELDQDLQEDLAVLANQSLIKML